MMCNQKYYYGEERATTFVRFRTFVGKLRKRFSLLAATKEVVDSDFGDEESEVPTVVAEDVKEGHFAVVAAKGSEKRRLVIELEHLNSPMFLSLFEQAEEEYGFEQTGALVVPCRPKELHKILGRHNFGKL